jgi:hypothetical protein
MYMCTYVYIHAHRGACLVFGVTNEVSLSVVCVRVCVCVNEHTYIHTGVCTCVCVKEHTSRGVHMHVRVCACV